MEFELVPQLIVVFSTAIIIFILGKNISKTENIVVGGSFVVGEKESEAKKKFFYLYKRLVGRINKEEYQKKIGLFWVWMEKVLRKIRINFLKFDGKIVSLLDKLRKKNTAGNVIETKTKAENKTEDKVEDKIKKEIKDTAMNDFINSETADKEANNDMDLELTDREKEEKPNTDEKPSIAENKTKTKKETEYIYLISKNPFDIKLYWKLGVIYSRRRNYKDAISCFRQITKIDPAYTKAKNKIMDLAERMKKKEKTEKEEENKEKL